MRRLRGRGSFSAIKIVSTTLFDALGLRGWLDKERAKARERLRIKQKAYEKACARCQSAQSAS